MPALEPRLSDSSTAGTRDLSLQIKRLPDHELRSQLRAMRLASPQLHPLFALRWLLVIRELARRLEARQ